MGKVAMPSLLLRSPLFNIFKGTQDRTHLPASLAPDSTLPGTPVEQGPGTSPGALPTVTRDMPRPPEMIRYPAPLRVVRIRDSHGCAPGEERLVISGRMADVCAELERLDAALSRQRLH